MASTTPAPRPTVFKVFGQWSRRVWKEVKPPAPGSPGDDVVKPEEFSDFLLDFINSPNLLVLAGSGTSLADKVGGPSMSKLWQAAVALTGFTDTLKIVSHPASDENIENLLSRCKSAIQFLNGGEKDRVEAFVK